MSLTYVAVSVANNFVHFQTGKDYELHDLGEMARFIYCLLRKIKKSSPLPLVEQWAEFITPNHSRFPAIHEMDFLIKMRVVTILNKVGSQSLKTEFRPDARRFLDEFVDCLLSTVASRSLLGLGLSCFFMHL